MTAPGLNEELSFAAGPDGAIGPTFWNRNTIASIIITIAVFAVLLSYVDLEQVWREVAASNKVLLLLGALFHYGTYPVRGMRWKRCLGRVPHRCGNGRFGLLSFFFLFVDNVIPAKLGDVYGAHLAWINCGVRRPSALGSIVFQRMLDVWLVLLLAAAASLAVFSTDFPVSVAWALAGASVLAVVASAVVAGFLVMKRAIPSWVPKKLHDRIDAFRTGMLPEKKELVPVLFLTAAIWTLESLWVYFLVLAFGLDPGPGAVVFLTMIPVIASAFPFTPSGAGAVDVTLFSSLRLVGVASPAALSLTVVNRFIDFWLHIILGTLVWVFRSKIGLRTWRDLPADGVIEPRSVATKKEVAS